MAPPIGSTGAAAVKRFIHAAPRWLTIAGSTGAAAVMLKAIYTTVAHQARCTVVSEAHRCEVSERPICGKRRVKVSERPNPVIIKAILISSLGEARS